MIFATSLFHNTFILMSPWTFYPPTKLSAAFDNSFHCQRSLLLLLIRSAMAQNKPCNILSETMKHFLAGQTSFSCIVPEPSVTSSSSSLSARCDLTLKNPPTKSSICERTSTGFTTVSLSLITHKHSNERKAVQSLCNKVTISIGSDSPRHRRAQIILSYLPRVVHKNSV